VKLRPSGQVFCAPLHNLVSSAKGTSWSLLPADTTTAMFLAAVAQNAHNTPTAIRAAMRSSLELHPISVHQAICLSPPLLEYRQT
jgi:hypothetical protein